MRIGLLQVKDYRVWFMGVLKRLRFWLKGLPLRVRVQLYCRGFGKVCSIRAFQDSRKFLLAGLGFRV